eukprot:1760154-Amphidinium_carterae.1
MNILQDPRTAAQEWHGPVRPLGMLMGTIVAPSAPALEPPDAATGAEVTQASAVAAWNCFQCTYRHEGEDAQRATCKICGAPRKSQDGVGDAVQVPATNVPSSSSSAHGEQPAPPVEPYPWPPGPWSCTECTYRHETEAEQKLSACAVCEANRPKPQQPPIAEEPQVAETSAETT